MKEKAITESTSTISRVMMPSEANAVGNVHGGEIMKIMDTAGAVAAMRHAKLNVVTLRVDELIFICPIFVGQLVTCKAQLVYVGNTSMEVLVTVFVEDLTEDKTPHIAQTAFFTFVALGVNGKPTQVPRLLLTNEQEEKDFFNGKKRSDKRRKKA